MNNSNKPKRTLAQRYADNRKEHPAPMALALLVPWWVWIILIIVIVVVGDPIDGDLYRR